MTRLQPEIPENLECPPRDVEAVFLGGRPQRMKHRIPKLVGRFRPLPTQHTREELPGSKQKHLVLILPFSQILLRRFSIIGNQKPCSPLFDINPSHLQAECFRQSHFHLPLEDSKERPSCLFRLQLGGPGTALINYEGYVHNLAVWDFEIQDSYQVTAILCQHFISQNKPTDNWIRQIPEDTTMLSSARWGLNPSYSSDPKNLKTTRSKKNRKNGAKGPNRKLALISSSRHHE